MVCSAPHNCFLSNIQESIAFSATSRNAFSGTIWGPSKKQTRPKTRNVVRKSVMDCMGLTPLRGLTAGVSLDACCILIPLGVVIYCSVGGLKVLNDPHHADKISTIKALPLAHAKCVQKQLS
jgi:hypothetical protein